MNNQVVNPFLPSWEYIPDGEPRVFGDRLYLYGSHDLFNGPDFCLGDYVCWSAPLEDLSDWRYETGFVKVYFCLFKLIIGSTKIVHSNSS